MKFTIIAISFVLAISAQASSVPYANELVAYSNPWPLKTSTVWPAYGSKVAVVPDVAISKYAYPNVYGSWPVYGKNWGYSAPVVAAKVDDYGLWNYGTYGNGVGYNRYWL